MNKRTTPFLQSKSGTWLEIFVLDCKNALQTMEDISNTPKKGLGEKKYLIIDISFRYKSKSVKVVNTINRKQCCETQEKTEQTEATTICIVLCNLIQFKSI